MGQGEETKTREEPSIEIQERGEIFFFYRPKVGKEEAHGADVVQRLYLVLRPESGGERRIEENQYPHSGKEGAKEHQQNLDDKQEEKEEEEKEEEDGSEQVDIEKQPLLRFIVMGRKSLPDPSKKSRPYWGFVEMVTTNIQLIKDALQAEEYETATRGHRQLPDSRAVGEGVYRILRHNPPTGKKKKMHTHLIYKLEYPSKSMAAKAEEEREEALNIAREASFIIQIKNPEQQQQFRGLQQKRKAAFPAQIQGQFGHRRFIPADPPHFLNYEGCEFLLISASDDIEQELGLDLKTELQLHEEEDGDQCSDLVNTFGDSAAASTRSLFEATWA